MVTDPTNNHGQRGPGVLLDLDTVILATHPGKYGPELGVQADLPAALQRLGEVSERIVVVVNPKKNGDGHVMDTDRRIAALRGAIDGQLGDLNVVRCAHGENGSCTCAKPETGLIADAMSKFGIDPRHSWYVGGDQEGVFAGRHAGLHTVRIGPTGQDHLSAVHRPDYEARDLMDAANHIILDALTTS